MMTIMIMMIFIKNAQISTPNIETPSHAKQILLLVTKGEISTVVITRDTIISLCRPPHILIVALLRSVLILSFNFFSVVQEVPLLQLSRAFFHRIPSTCSTHYLTSKNHKSNRSVRAHRSCAFCSGCVLFYLDCTKRQK
jgi:hypothetical protein